MCTLSFLPRDNGYLVAMNRDERLTRESALPPRAFDLGGCRAIFPHERSGGTWIGGNEFGIALAILNQSVENGGAQKIKSRGTIVPKLLVAGSSPELRALVQELDIRRTLPFKLMGFFPLEKAVNEWNWNGVELSTKAHSWQRGNWYSSGLSDETAARERGATFEKAWTDSQAGTLTWVRKLHRSHWPKRGAFSICVHREDAQTVSYSELSFADRVLELRYRPGPPCRQATTHTARLKVRRT